MLKPPHPVARAAYALAMSLNPNNHALDGGRASSRMEIEAVREIAAMFGWSEFLGHLTSGGNLRQTSKRSGSLDKWPPEENCRLPAGALHPQPQ